MSRRSIARFQAAILIIAPAVLAAALTYHPYIPNLTDQAAVAGALSSDYTRWGFAHLAVAVGFGLMVLAFLALRSYLREAGEELWSIVGLPFIVMGSILAALLPAMEIAMLAPAELGADVEAAQRALNAWFMPILFGGAIVFAIGVFAFARGIAVSGALDRPLAGFVVAALVVMALTRFVPLGGSLYLGGVAGILALWPLSMEVLKMQSSESLPSAKYSPAAASPNQRPI